MKIVKKGSSQELNAFEDPNLGSYYRVIENCPYIVEAEEGELKHPAVTHLKAGMYELVFNNFVGWAWVGGELLKVRTPKLSEKEFDAMLNQITEVYASLPFAFNTPSFLPFERIAPGGEEILYHAFMYLRYLVLDSEPCLEAIMNRIMANPHRVMIEEEIRQGLHLARRVRPTSINRLASCPRDLIDVEQAPHLAGYEIASRLEDISRRKYFPTHVYCIKRDATVDNPENRFVKYFLVHCLYIADLFHRHFIQLVKAGRAIDYSLVHDACSVVEAIEGILVNGFFDELGEMRHLPYNSQVLQKGPGYRELFSHFNRMNLGSTYPIGSTDLRKVIENKDVALLYEYWTFFACLDLLKRILGDPRNAAFASSGILQSELPWEVRIDFDEGASLFYNKTYRSNSKESYSLPYRPDISLETQDGIYIFDAKFKKEKIIYNQFEGDKTAETEEEEYGQGFKYGDINKMHCYRDAIDGVKAAFILYPGDRFRFFHRTAGKASSPESLQGFDGVGAIPLKASAKHRGDIKGAEALEQVFEKILRQ